MSASQRKKNGKVMTILIRDGNCCIYCDTKFETREDITIEHVYPRKLGGTNGVYNLALSCKECNEKKGNMLLTQFLRAYEIPVTKKIARFL